MRRISYCGTDGYMSPEILLGVDFGLPSDVFSLGVIFCEIASRHLVDSTTFKREMPSFGLDEDEIRDMASEGCPEAFVDLCIDCVEVEPENRPDMREIVARLRDIENEVVEREMRESQGRTLRSVGSVRGTSLKAVLGGAGGSKRPGVGPRMPSFDGQVQLSQQQVHEHEEDEDEDEEELESALAQLEAVSFENGTLGAKTADGNATATAGETMKVSGHGNPWWDTSRSTLPSIRKSWVRPTASEALNGGGGDGSTINGNASSIKESRMASGDSDYSTSVVRKKKSGSAEDEPSSVFTVRASKDDAPSGSGLDASPANANGSFLTASSRFSAGGHGQEPSLAVATVASSIYSPAPLYHRFTLVKNGIKRVPSLSRLRGGDASTSSASSSSRTTSPPPGTAAYPTALGPPAIMLANALSKCHVCARRIGWKPFLDCDDCSYKCHVGCGDAAEPTCQEIEIPAAGTTVGGSTSGLVTTVHARGTQQQRSASNGSSQSEASSASSSNASPKQRANGGQAAHALRQAAAAAHASYANEGGEAVPPPTEHSALKGMAARRSQSPAIAAGGAAQEERKVKGLRRWSAKPSPTRA